MGILIYYLLVVFGWIGLLKDKEVWHAILLIIIPFCLLLELLLAFGSARFALPAAPSFAVFFAIGVGKFQTISLSR